MHDLDLDGIGLTVDELDLDLDSDDDDLPPLRLDRPRYRPTGWWTPTPLEEFHLELPAFNRGVERAAYFVREMGRAALSRIAGATADDAMFDYHGDMVSLNDLLSVVEGDGLAEALGRFRPSC